MDEVTSAAAAAPAAPAARELPLEFRGTGAEYFRIWIVNLLLTILTLGIFSAWAKVRRLRYFYGSTSLDGSSFEYHGRPVAILKGRVLVAGLYLVFAVVAHFWPAAQLAFIPLVVFGLPWVIVRARLFQMRMTSWRGLRFNFHGRYGGAMAAYVGWPLLGMLTLGLLWPLALWKQVNYILTHTAFGTRRFGFVTGRRRFFRFCYITVAMFLGSTFVMAMVLAAVLMLLGLLDALPRGASPVVAQAMPILSAALFTLVALVAGAYFRAHFTNASIGGAVLPPHALRSRLDSAQLFRITITNLLAMIVTLGLFYPWARVRLMRYQLAHTSVLVQGDLDQFVAATDVGASAVGEEASDFFDIDFGL